MKVIDGSFGEGGGQILRTAVALSCILGIPIKVINIRARRPEPGLKRQHITAINAAATLCNAVIEGLTIGSTTVTFNPGSIRAGAFKFNIGTAGSITLVLQTLLPIMAFAPSSVEVTVSGGTDVPWSPPIDYLRGVVLHYLKLLGYRVNVDVFRRGHYPKGGGVVRVSVERPPRGFSGLNLERRGEVLYVEGRSHCVKLPKHVAERQARAAKERLREGGLAVPVRIEVESYEPTRDPHLGPGSGIVLWAVTSNKAVLGADSLGARGKRAEVVGAEAAEALIREVRSGMALDKHMSDNIVPYLALAKGTSLIGGSELTLHAYTNLWLINKIAGVGYELNGDLGKPFTLRINGLGIHG